MATQLPAPGPDLRPLADGIDPDESEVLYESAGRILINGSAQACAAAAVRISPRLDVLVLSPGSPPDGVPPDLPWRRGHLASLDGYLGHFRAAASMHGTAAPEPTWMDPNGHFDLILDLGASPAIDRRIAPLGYFAPQGDPGALKQALDTLPRLTGRLAKPRYFQYRESFCTHSRQGQTGCSRCLSACPAGAIDSASGAIRFDPHLCQGCGTCTLVCPTGAVRYRHPSAEDLQEQLWQLVRTGDTHRPPALILCEPGSEAAVRAATGQSGGRHAVVGVLPVIAALGMDTWLGFLAAGVPSVTLCPASDQSEPQLSTEIELSRQLLSGLGHDPDRLALRKPGHLTGAADRPATERRSGIGFSPGGRESDKRARVTAALAALVGGPPVVPNGILSLPEGAPFGEVVVDRARCTLCMACVRVCPRKALRSETVSDGGAPAALAFVENDCVQCGLCREACPESAVTLAPRFVFDPAARTGVRVINESDMALCLNCGAPVASEAMTRRMEERLRAHPMFAGEALKRLRLCEACKAASAAGVRLTRFSGDGSGNERG